jgi:hypothetical protein
MKRLIGIALLTLGAVPLAAGWLMWADHTYTLGLSHSAEAALAALLIADIVCLSVGLYLIVAGSSLR